jgi:hypothetical protein
MRATIQFRCWYCNRAYSVSPDRIGKQFECGCNHTLRVPKKSGGPCQIKTATDRLVEAVVYGGGCALLGLGLGLLLASQMGFLLPFRLRVVVLAFLTVSCFLLGLLGGERGVNWLGRIIREREGR